jgi:hypothetical protein
MSEAMITRAINSRELRTIRRYGIIADDEMWIEMEIANSGWKAGMLVVTDQRVVFVSTSFLLKRPRVIAVPLERIMRFDTRSDPDLSRGKLTLFVETERGDDLDELKFHLIPGGAKRVKELVRAIVAEKNRLRSSGSGVRANHVVDTS